MPLDIVLLVNNLVGGTYGNQANRLAAGLVPDPRCRVTLLGYGAQTEVPPRGIARVDRLPAPRALRSGRPLVHYLLRHQPDVLVTHQVHMNLVAALAATWARRRGWQGKLVLGHDHPILLSHRENRRDNRHLARLLYRVADLVMSPSPSVARDAVESCRVPADRVVVVPNPIDAPPPLERPDHPWFRGDAPVFVSVGRLVTYKRFDLLADAVGLVGGTARLAIAGTGVAREALEAHVKARGLEDRVTFLGFVDDPRPYMAYATGFVLASEEEGFSQVLAEAMSTGCPVITTDSLGGGPRYVTDDGHFGQLVPLGDTEAIAAAMRRLLDPEERARWSQRSLERVDEFSPERCAELLLDALDARRSASWPVPR